METVHNTFKLKTFNIKTMNFSDWRKFDGSLLLQAEIDGHPKVYSHDRWSYWVSELDHTEMVLKKKFRWPHKVLRLKSHNIYGKRYWLVGSMNRASLAKRLNFADVDFLTSTQDIADGSFVDDGDCRRFLFRG